MCGPSSEARCTSSDCGHVLVRPWKWSFISNWNDLISCDYFSFCDLRVRSRSDVPKVGGGTNFQNSNVYVKPTLHAAAFFSYMDPLRREMETGFTSHSGCPVIEGTKRIAVHWMRVGVDDDNPWDSFNTLTIQKSAIADCD